MPRPATLRARQIASNRKTKAGTAIARPRCKGFEQPILQFRHYTRAIVGNSDNKPARAFIRGNGNGAIILRLQGLCSIAQQIEDDAVKMFRIGIGLTRLRDFVMQSHLAARPAPDGEGGLCRFVNNWCQQHFATHRRPFIGSAITQGIGGKANGTIQCRDKPWGQALHHRIVDRAEPVGCQLRAGENIAQIVLYPRNRGPQCGEPRFLLQGRIKIALHFGQFTLGNAHFVTPVRRHHNARSIFRIVAKADHGLGDTPHRPDQHKIKA